MVAHESDERVSLSEAAKLVGKSPSTIRRLLDTGSLNSIRDETGKHFVVRKEVFNHYSLAAHSHNSQITSNVRQSASSPRSDSSQSVHTQSMIESAKLTAENHGLRAQLELIQQSLKREQTRNDNLEKEIISLINEMKAILSKESGLSKWFRK
jgi:excisionase family DNA binding protein